MKTSRAAYMIWLTVKYAVSLTVIYLKVVITVDVKPQKEKYTPDYTVYHNLSSISNTVEKLLNENPGFIMTEKGHLSGEGRSQHLLRMSNFTNYDKKQKKTERLKIFLSFGDHAREFLPVESCFCLIKYLLHQTLTNSGGINYLNDLDLYILVIGNPDGRHLVEIKHNYCWRGTKNGVDINRNMGWEFGGQGSSRDRLDEEYRGNTPFSESESLIYRDLPKHVKFDAFLSLHSGIKQIYIPYADTKSRKTGREPDNVKDMMSLAKLLSTATKFRYQYGKAATLNEYTADGTVFDFMAGIHKIPFSYAIELWGPDGYRGPSCFDLFNPPNQKLQTVIDDLIPLYTTLFDYLIKWKQRYSTTNRKSEPSNPEPYHLNNVDVERENVMSEVPSLTPGYTLLVLVVIVTFLVGLHGRYPIFRRFYQRRRVISLRALSSTFSANMFSP